MLASLAWINAYLDRPVSLEEAAETLTSVGFPVEDTRQADGGDVALDVEVTSNRPDMLSHVGVARELAAALGRVLSTPGPPAVAVEPAEPKDKARVSIDDAGCSLFTGTVIRGVKVGPSPDWLRTRLEAVGLRSISNVVDVTNFVLLELGQPLHTYDLGKLAGGRLTARASRRGEVLTTLDGKRHELPDGLLVIADDRTPQGLAGVMGGAESEVTRGTTDLFLEAARFDPLRVRTAARGLKIASDSSYRFERGVDSHRVAYAAQRAVALILETAGGRVDGAMQVAGAVAQDAPAIRYRPARCSALLGFDVSYEEQAVRLERLGLTVDSEGAAAAGAESVSVVPPTFRDDLRREVDLIEEVARTGGLDAIPLHDSAGVRVGGSGDAETVQRARKAILRTMIGWGYCEAITHSLVSDEAASAMLPAGVASARLHGAEGKAEAALRPSVLSALLRSAKSNQDAGNHGVRLFEIGGAWSPKPDDAGRLTESRRLAWLIEAPSEPGVHVRECRGVVDELVRSLAGPDAVGGLLVASADRPGYEAAAVATLEDGRELGVFGLLDEKARDAFGLQHDVAVGELDLGVLESLYDEHRAVSTPPAYPAIERDLSVVLDEATPYADVLAAVRSADPARLESVDFVGVFRGKPVGKGRKSVTLRMVFRDPGATLRREQVEPEVESVVAKLAEACGAELRAG
ncbi:MAG: phenylalanine--tRNA ligase subunit beta [Planctomycetota bacterium]